MKIFKILDVLLIALFIGMLAVNVAQVFFRYVVGASLFWSEEASIMMMIVTVFMGTAVLIRDDEHIIIELFNPNGTSRAIRIMNLVRAVAVVMILIAFGYLVLEYFMSAISRGAKTTALRMPMWVPIGAMLFGTALSGLFAAGKLYRSLAGFKVKEAGK